MENELKQIGFKENEIKIYLFLAKNPSSLASKIAKNTGLYRPYVYDAIQKLISKGLVSYIIKSGKKYFSASPPHKIISEIEMEEEKLAKKKKIAKELMPKISRIFEESEEEYSINVFEGREGLKAYYEFLLQLGQEGKLKEIYSYGGKGHIFETLEFYFPHFLKRIKKAGFFNKIKYYLLWDYSKKGSKEHEDLKKMIRIKFLPEEFSMPAGGVVFLDYFIIVKPKEPSLIIRIKNKEIADSFEQLFKGLWKISKA